MNIPQLTRFQCKMLQNISNGPVPVVVIPATKDSDDDDLKADLDRKADEVDKLVSYGLMQNVSAEFAGSVLDHFTKSGRMTSVYEATEHGRLLFKKSSTRITN